MEKEYGNQKKKETWLWWYFVYSKCIAGYGMCIDGTWDMIVVIMGGAWLMMGISCVVLGLQWVYCGQYSVYDRILRLVHGLRW